MPRTKWDKHAIKAEVYRKGHTLADVARKAGFAPSTIRSALISPRSRANHAIAECIGVSVHELWPDWFDKEGTLKSRGEEPNSTTGPRASEKQRAA